MTKEEKQLLIKDLSARLPHGVKVNVTNSTVYKDPMTVLGIDYSKEIVKIGDNIGGIFFTHSEHVADVKPYLRPMESMTDIERDELHKYTCVVWNDKNDSHSEYERKTYSESLKFDWLNQRMFDYRGLIYDGLALVAPDGMYNDKNE